MDKITGNEPAMPCNYVKTEEGNVYNSTDDNLGGLTIRQLFQKDFMCAIISGIYSNAAGYKTYLDVASSRGYKPKDIDAYIALDAKEKVDAAIEQLNK